MAQPARAAKPAKPAKPQRRLQAVTASTPKPTRATDPDLTREALEGWSEGQRKCRARGRHYWRPFTVWEHRNFYEVVEQCADCRNRHTADFTKTGRRLTKWFPIYRDGYLLPKGAAPIEPEQKDELVLADLLSRRIVEAPTDADDADDAED